MRFEFFHRVYNDLCRIIYLVCLFGQANEITNNQCPKQLLRLCGGRSIHSLVMIVILHFCRCEVEREEWGAGTRSLGGKSLQGTKKKTSIAMSGAHQQIFQINFGCNRCYDTCPVFSRPQAVGHDSG